MRETTIAVPGLGFMRIFSALTGLLLLVGCATDRSASSLHRYEFSSPHMGTLFTITLYAPDDATAKTAVTAAFARVAELDAIMSDYQADSELMRLCDQPPGTPVPISADLFQALQVSQEFARLSGGAFDVTVGPFVRLWRFSRKRKILPTPAEMETARAAVGWRKLRLDPNARTATLLVPNMRLDLGGIGKGYAADQALTVLRKHGLSRALVAASGDIAIGDPPPGERGWKIAIAGLDSTPNAILHNAGVSTSGDTEQFVEISGVRYSHIVDPTTGLGLTNHLQDTVIAPNATTSDGLDTTVNVLGRDRGLKLVDSLPHTAALILTEEKGVKRSFASKGFGRLAKAQRNRD